MLMSRRLNEASLFFFLLLFVFLGSGAAAAGPSKRQFSTVAITHTSNSTIVCALVLDKDDSGGGSGSGGAKLRCVSLPSGEVTTYPSADVPFNAIAAGKDFLCGLMAPTGGHAAMRWWSFSEEAAANRSRPVGRRLYWGASLRSMAAGGAHACGLSDDHDPTCWEWPSLSLPKGLDFSLIALGHDFLCGIVKNDSADLRCFSGGASFSPTSSSSSSFMALAAGRRHACAVDDKGELVCWGDGNPAVVGGELPKEMAAMALGHNTTCILGGDGRVRCWGVEVPPELRTTAFVAVEAEGGAVCGVAAVNYAVVCWSNDGRFGKKGRVVFNETMPGSCAPRKSCQCDVVSGSGALCGTGGGNGAAGELAVCQPCKVALSRLVISDNGRTAVDSSSESEKKKKKKKKKKIAKIVGISVPGAVVLLVAGMGVVFVFKRKRAPALEKKKKKSVRLGESSSQGLCRDIESSMAVSPAPEKNKHPQTNNRPLGCEEFTLKDLSRLTNGFAEEAKIGAGSFGSVYRATLADGREVAIKRAERRPNSSATGGGERRRQRRRFDAERAFRSELRLLSRVNHRNLVSLLGFCEERGERILVFEFMPHGALHDHLHADPAGAGEDNHSASPLFTSWEARLRVALDAARGVEYLHCYAVPAIIHRDIKPSNILLDADWTAKVSDFGLSLVSSNAGGSTTTTTATTTASTSSASMATAGTVGYMDPEYYRLQELTERSDVYSFGVVLLELVTGRKAIHRDRSSPEGSGSPRNVIEFAVPAVEAGEVEKILDGRVPPPRGHEVEAVARVAKIGAECVRPRGRGRPVMSEVVAELEWAVTLCEECVVRNSGGRNYSSSDMSRSRNGGGGDISRSRSRSESDEPSPYHTRELEFSFHSGPSASVVVSGAGGGGVVHGRSHSTM